MIFDARKITYGNEYIIFIFQVGGRAYIPELSAAL